MVYAIRPSFDFDLTLPLGKNFGIVMSGMNNNRFLEQHLSRTNYVATGAGTNASIARPFLQSYTRSMMAPRSRRGTPSVSMRIGV